MVIMAIDQSERLIKSQDRVRDLAEVFTPAATVQDMLDLLPDEMWQIHPSPTFLEPSCGDGNFLVAILDRKLAAIGRAHAAGQLPAGTSATAAQFHALEALASIYAVDISHDNVVGGTPGHEVGARARLIQQLQHWHEQTFSKRLAPRSLLLQSATWVVENNVIIGNMLPRTSEGEPTGRDELPLKIYTWQPQTLQVTVHETTLGAVLSQTAAEATGELTLFGPPEPRLLWAGEAERLHQIYGGESNAG